MARRSGLPSSLFPFMSVLACTIGALIVLLAILSLSAVETSEAAQRADRSRQSEQHFASLSVAQETETLDRAEAAWRALDAELERRGMESEEDGFSIARAIDRARRLEATRAAIAEVEAERESLRGSRGEVEASIEVLASRRKTLPILIDPTDLAPRWQPFFVECDDGGATLYRARDGLSYFVPTEEVAMTGDFARYMRRVRAESGSLLVLLVRSGGLPTSRRVAEVAEQAGVRVARLPLPGDGALDWSMLAAAEAAGDGEDGP